MGHWINVGHWIRPRATMRPSFQFTSVARVCHLFFFFDLCLLRIQSYDRSLFTTYPVIRSSSTTYPVIGYFRCLECLLPSDLRLPGIIRSSSTTYPIIVYFRCPECLLPSDLRLPCIQSYELSHTEQADADVIFHDTHEPHHVS